MKRGSLLSLLSLPVICLGLVGCNKTESDISKYALANISDYSSIGVVSKKAANVSEKKTSRTKKEKILTLNSNTSIVSTEPFYLGGLSIDGVTSELTFSSGKSGININVNGYGNLGNFSYFYYGSLDYKSDVDVLSLPSKGVDTDHPDLIHGNGNGDMYFLSKKTGKIYANSGSIESNFFVSPSYIYGKKGNEIFQFSESDEGLALTSVSGDNDIDISSIDKYGNLLSTSKKLLVSTDRKGHSFSTFLDGNEVFSKDPYNNVFYTSVGDEYYIIDENCQLVKCEGRVGCISTNFDPRSYPIIGGIMYDDNSFLFSEGKSNYYFLGGVVYRITVVDDYSYYFDKLYSFGGGSFISRDKFLYVLDNGELLKYDLLKGTNTSFTAGDYSITEITEDAYGNIVVSGFDNSAFKNYTGYLDENDNVVFTPTNETGDYQTILLTAIN